MAKASLVMMDGTKVQIDGSPEEIIKILGTHKMVTKHTAHKQKDALQKIDINDTDLTDIINAIKSCQEADLIEKNILDSNGLVDRILLPLYIIHGEESSISGLTSGDIAKILAQLGIGIHVANISKTLSSAASKYVLGDKIRKKGQPVRYKISRKGMAYLRSVIQVKENG
ncbi:MAG: hypothetical protein KKH83_08125 [Candidatus Margulisbacteria bacterium]|nr:hypothetical protein [Candidatus Margulisiibacteriota bacterium]